jgi:hypothetical protein
MTYDVNEEDVDIILFLVETNLWHLGNSYLNYFVDKFALMNFDFLLSFT